MCLGEIGQVSALGDGGVALIAVADVERRVLLATLDETVALGDWLVVHSGFALARLDPDEAAAALTLRATPVDPAATPPHAVTERSGSRADPEPPAPVSSAPGDGVARFARYAYPPNALGYCGPSGTDALPPVVRAEERDRVRRAARRFDGAWPYLSAIAAAHGIPDPLDGRVVQAYWIGGPLLDGIGPLLADPTVATRLAHVAAPVWPVLSEALGAGGLPHHSFHVFSVYPWLRLLRAGRAPEPLHVLDRCRIRWGQVVSVAGDTAVLRVRPLTWDGAHLDSGPTSSGTGPSRPGRPADGARSASWPMVFPALGLGVRAAQERRRGDLAPHLAGPSAAGAGQMRSEAVPDAGHRPHTP